LQCERSDFVKGRVGRGHQGFGAWRHCGDQRYREFAFRSPICGQIRIEKFLDYDKNAPSRADNYVAKVTFLGGSDQLAAPPTKSAARGPGSSIASNAFLGSMLVPIDQFQFGKFHHTKKNRQIATRYRRASSRGRRQDLLHWSM
jgi:hypothetical protein